MDQPVHRRPFTTRRAAFALGTVLCLHASLAEAWVLTIGSGARRLYLQVGNGTLDANNATVNRVSLNVPVDQVGSGVPLQMTSDSTQAISPLDNYVVCVPPAQVYVGGSFRNPNNSGSARLQVSSPANLTNATGDVIPFNTISWSSTALGNTAADIPAGTFNGGTLVLRNIAANNYVENCHTFTYSNTAIRAAGTYDGQVTYTLINP